MAIPKKEEKDRRQKGEKEDDGFSFVCSICKDFGELLCCDRCRDSFHLSCLGFEECPDTDPWLCSTCSQNKVSFSSFPFSSSLLRFQCEWTNSYVAQIM